MLLVMHQRMFVSQAAQLLGARPSEKRGRCHGQSRGLAVVEIVHSGVQNKIPASMRKSGGDWFDKGAKLDYFSFISLYSTCLRARDQIS